RLHAKQFQPVGRLHGRLGNLLGTGIQLDVGVQEEPSAGVVDHAGHCGGAGNAAVEVENAAQVTELLVEAADDAADHRVCFAPLHHQGRDQARTRADQALGRLDGHTATLGQGVVLLPIIVEARVVVDVGQLE